MRKKTEALKSNSQLIREVLDSGTTKPADILVAMKKQYGVDVNKWLISQVKNGWSKGQKTTTSPTQKAKPKARAAKSPSQQADAFNGTKTMVTELDVAKFALKMGGVKQAIAELQKLL